MNKKELRWTLSGTLVLIFALSLGLNSAIFNNEPTATLQDGQGGRGIASRALDANAWEKRSFEFLESGKGSGQSSVQALGQSPTDLDQLALGRLQGNYGIQVQNGKITGLQLTQNQQASAIPNPVAFLSQHRRLLGKGVQTVRQVFADDNGETSLQRFELLTQDGQSVGLVSLTLNNEQGLLSASVQ